MKALRIWGWLLFVASIFLWLYGWMSGEYNGHGIAKMDKVALMITVFSGVCFLLAITVGFITLALKEKRVDR